MRFTTQLLAVALAVADLTFAQNYTNATTNATTLALEAELTNLEHFWSYGRSPPVYPSPIGQGNGDWAASYAKAQALVAQMTNEEKNNITYGYTSTSNGCAGNSGAVHRLDFPGLCLQDAGNGVRGTDGVNGYPAGVHVGASWNKNLAYNRAQYMGAEFKAKGVNVLLGPVVGPLGRVAEMGRNWEGFAADPYLTGSLTFETVRGIQESVISCIKHLVAYEQETNRNPSTDGYNASVSSNLDDKSMHELYLWPFQDAVHAGVGSVMCSYNRVNNSYACQNSAVQNGLLKTELGFEGFVVSDWGAQHTGLASAEAGLDMAMPSSVYWQGNLSTAVTNGSLPQTRLDDMATRIVAAWYQYAELEHPGHGMPLNLTLPHELVDARDPASKPTLFQGAVEGHVLVKNTNNALPLKTPRYLSLFGYDAVSPNSNTPSNAALSKWDFGYQGVGQVTDAVLYDVFVDPTSVPSSELPQIAGNGTMWTGGGSGAATPAYIDAPYNAIQRQAMDDGTFLSWDFTSQSPIVERASETCLVFINEFASEGFDRPGLADSDSDELVLNVAAQCNNTMVIIHNAGIRLVDAWIENPNITAVMFAHLPGQDSGKALVEVLYGKQSPSGRLPYTVAKKAADYGSLLSPIRPDATSEYYTQANFTEGVYIDYRAFIAQNITPRFDFGYGLTYTTFDYSSLQTKVLTNVSTSEFPANTSVVEGGIASLWDVIATVDVTVTNTGSVTASEVAQLYVNIPGGPAKVLRGYSKQGVQPGKSVKFDFDLTRRDLSTWDTISQAWQLQSGSYPIYVGKSVLDIQLTGNLHI